MELVAGGSVINKTTPSSSITEYYTLCRTNFSLYTTPKLNTDKTPQIAGTELLSIKQAFESIVNQEIIAKAICKLIRKGTTMLDTLELTNEDKIPHGANIYKFLLMVQPENESYSGHGDYHTQKFS